MKTIYTALGLVSIGNSRSHFTLRRKWWALKRNFNYVRDDFVRALKRKILK